MIPDVLSKGKSPKDYKDREVNENEQVPINIKQKSPPPTLPKILPQKRDLGFDRAESKKTDCNTAKCNGLLSSQETSWKKRNVTKTIKWEHCKNESY